MRRASLAFSAALAVLGAGWIGAIGCGGRGPLEESAPSSATDAGVDAVVAAPADAGREAGVLACGSCVVTTCGQPILACVQSAPCRDVLRCITSTCAGGAGTVGRDGGARGVDTGCILGCATNDISGGLAVLGVFQCLTGTCGGDCSTVLGGLAGGAGLGLGGLGGGGAAPPPGKALPIDGEDLVEVLAPWPELLSSSPL